MQKLHHEFVLLHEYIEEHYSIQSKCFCDVIIILFIMIFVYLTPSQIT